MTVFENYFGMLRPFLPKDRRDDIVRELSEELRAQVADKESALGRPLNVEEEAAIIRQYGHPLVTAARFRPQRSVIGPIVFPYYWLALRLFLGLTLVGQMLGAAITLARDPWGVDLGFVENAAGNLLQVLGWTTALAAGVDLWLTRSRVLDRWDPRTLPVWPSARLLRDDRRPSISDLIVGAVLSIWWLLALTFPSPFMWPDALNLHWGPAMDRLYPVLVTATLVSLADSVVKFASKEPWTFVRFSRFVWLATGVVSIVVAASDHRWLAWQGENRVDPAIEFANLALSVAFVVAGAGGVFQFVRTLVRRRYFFSGNSETIV